MNIAYQTVTAFFVIKKLLLNGKISIVSRGVGLKSVGLARLLLLSSLVLLKIEAGEAPKHPRWGNRPNWWQGITLTRIEWLLQLIWGSWKRNSVLLLKPETVGSAWKLLMKESNQGEEHLRGYRFVYMAVLFKVDQLKLRECRKYSVHKLLDLLLFSQFVFIVSVPTLI